MIKRVWRLFPEPDWYWVYDVYVGGRRLRTPRGQAFPTKEECRNAVSSIRTDFRRECYDFPADRSRVKVSELRDAWIDRLTERGRSQKHIKRTDRALRLFERALSPGVVVAEIETEHIERYFSALLRRIKPQTAAVEVTTIMTALNNAPSLFRSLANWRPPRKPKNISQPASGRERIITREEEALIIEALMLDGNPLHKQDARIFWFALRTGMREGEILGLLKTSVCFDRAIKMEHGWIEVRRSQGSERTKSGKKRIIPMSRTVASMLKKQMAGSKSIYVFPGNAGRRRVVTTLLSRIEQACVQAGIPYGNDKPGGIVFHDTRHTAATRMLHAGIDLKTAGAILGHSDQYMTMRYAHATAASMQEAVSSLEDDGFFDRFESTFQTHEAHPAHYRPKGAAG